MSSVPVNVVVCQLMMYSNVIVDITISRGSFVFSHSRVQANDERKNNLMWIVFLQKSVLIFFQQFRQTSRLLSSI